MAEELYRPAPRKELTVFNPLPWRRRRLVGGTLVELDGFATATVERTSVVRTPSRARAIENERYRVEVQRDGTALLLHRVDSEHGVEPRRTPRRGRAAGALSRTNSALHSATLP